MEAASESGVRRAPIDMLARVFPHMKRSVLQLILQGCGGDVVQAIEQVLNNHNDNSSPAAGSNTSSSTETSTALVSHRPYITSTAPTLNRTSGGKSAFSPFTSLAAASNQLNPLRYAYTPNARGLALAMPYPPGFMPNLALGYPGYSAAALASAQKSTGLNPYASLCPCPYGTSPTDK